MFSKVFHIPTACLALQRHNQTVALEKMAARQIVLVRKQLFLLFLSPTCDKEELETTKLQNEKALRRHFGQSSWEVRKSTFQTKNSSFLPSSEIAIDVAIQEERKLTNASRHNFTHLALW